MANRLRDSDDFNARVVGWESRDGQYHAVYDADGVKIGRAPSDYSLEASDRVVVEKDGAFYTLPPLTEDYPLDEALHELEDFYSQVSG